MPIAFIARIIFSSIIGAFIGFLIAKILLGIEAAHWRWKMRRQFRKLNAA